MPVCSVAMLTPLKLMDLLRKDQLRNILASQLALPNNYCKCFTLSRVTLAVH